LVKPVELKKELSAASQLVLPENSGRHYALLVNDGVEDAYITLGPVAFVNRGIRLNNGGGSYEINATNLYQGTISAISTGTPSLLITEW